MEDQKIIDLYTNREERAIHETDKKYGRLCTSISMGILNDIRDSEECVSDTFIKGRAHGLRKAMVVIAFLMICCGSLTAYTYWGYGKELVESGNAATRYVPTVNWFADK